MAISVQIYKSKYYPGDAIEGVFTYTGGITDLLITAKVSSYTIGQSTPGGFLLDTPEIQYFSIPIPDTIFTTYPSLSTTTPITINYSFTYLSGGSGSVNNNVTTSAYLLSSSPPLLDIQSNGVGFMTSANTSGPYSLNIKEGAPVINFYPIGSLYFSINSTNPSAYFGGTWELFGPGRTIQGVSASQTLGEIESEIVDGEKAVTLTTDTMPAHTHQYRTDSKLKSGSDYRRIHSYGLGGSGAYAGYETSPTGGDQPHNNLQPYITCYIWKRTG